MAQVGWCTLTQDKQTARCEAFVAAAGENENVTHVDLREDRLSEWSAGVLAVALLSSPLGRQPSSHLRECTQHVHVSVSIAAILPICPMKIEVLYSQLSKPIQSTSGGSSNPP